MNFQGKCAIKLLHGLPGAVTQRVIKRNQIIVYGATSTCKNRGSMDPVHDKGVHGPGPWKEVHGPGPYFDGLGPWTGSTEGVHGPGVHVLYFPEQILSADKNASKFCGKWRLLYFKQTFYLALGSFGTWYNNISQFITTVPCPNCLVLALFTRQVNLYMQCQDG